MQLSSRQKKKMTIVKLSVITTSVYATYNKKRKQKFIRKTYLEEIKK